MQQCTLHIKWWPVYIITAISLLINTIIWVPFYCYRQIIISYARHNKRKELEPLATECVEFADESHLVGPDRNGILLVSVLELGGKLSTERFRAIFQKNVLEAKLGDSCRYPELRQYLVSVMGHWFWKWDPEFKIENHIREAKEVIQSVEQVHEHMHNTPMVHKMRSPWEVIIFSGLGEITWFALRTHHCLGDLRSMVKLVVECLAQQPISSAKGKKKLKRKLGIFDYLVAIPWSVVCVTVKIIEFRFRLRKHPWRVHDFKSTVSTVSVRTSREVQIDKISAASKRNNNACTSAFIMAVITGAIKKFEERYNLPVIGQMPMFCTLRRPNHPPRLANHVHCGTFNAPTHLETPLQRLRECDKIYCHMTEHSLERIGIEKSTAIRVGFPRCIRERAFPNGDGIATGLTNVAGENEEMFIGGLPVLDYSFTVGLGRTCVGVLFTIFSYRRRIRISMVARNSVFDERKLDSLQAFVNSEMEALIQ